MNKTEDIRSAQHITSGYLARSCRRSTHVLLRYRRLQISTRYVNRKRICRKVLRSSDVFIINDVL